MEKINITFNAKIVPVKPMNDEFTLCKCYICALGKNRNFSHIGKSACDDALASLFNIPVVGHLYKNDEGEWKMGGHDMTVEKDENGVYKFKSLCVPYGVVPFQDSVEYEEIEEPNGRGKKTYLKGDIILWTGRYPELREAIYSENIFFNQSMEINIADRAPLEEDQNYTDILKYSYSALCLLGKSDDKAENVEPCFPESKVEPYVYTVDEEFTSLMGKMKEELAFCLKDYGEKGEEMEANLENVATENPEVDAVDTEEVVNEPAVAPEEAVAPEVTEEFSAEDNSEANEEPEVVADEVSAPEPELFSATYRERESALRNLLDCEIVRDEEGRLVQETYYNLCDFDDVYAYYTVDVFNVDGYKAFRKRCKYSFDESSRKASMTSDLEDVVLVWMTPDEETALNKLRGEYAVLVEYKSNRERSDREAEFDSIIANFAELEGIEEFAAISDNRYSYESADALQNACYIVKGKNNIVTSAHKANNAECSFAINTNVNVDATSTPRERIHAKYGKR